jgi:hypothetical protein
MGEKSPALARPSVVTCAGTPSATSGVRICSAAICGWTRVSAPAASTNCRHICVGIDPPVTPRIGE